MAIANGTGTKTFTATLGRSNENGIQIAERPGVWLNFSKFGDRPALPPIGTVVKLTIDARGFIRALEALDGATPSDTPQPALPLAPALPPARGLSDSITRLAVLKAAARFEARDPNATTDDLIATATALLAWVEQP